MFTPRLSIRKAAVCAAAAKANFVRTTAFKPLKMLRGARKAAIRKLRRSVRSAGQRRVWAGRFIKEGQGSQLCTCSFLRTAACRAACSIDGCTIAVPNVSF